MSNRSRSEKLASRNKQSATKYEGLKYGEVDDNGFYVHCKSFDKIQSASELLQKAGLDPVEWSAVEVVPNQWEVVLKGPDGEADKQVLYQIKAKFKRRCPEHFTQVVDDLARRVPKLNLPKVKRARNGDSTWIVGLVDHHFGKLAWAPEVGSDYDLNIAENMWRAAIDHTADQIVLAGRKIKQILLPAGNDFFHFDNREGATTAGTPQHADGRWQKVYECGQRAFLYAIETLRQVGKVKVMWVPGNHDYLSSYWLCKVAQASFGNKVEFDIGADPIKYHSEGNCFWTFAHGQEPSYKALCEMVPVVRADDWAAGSACREVICGHTHQSKAVSTTSTWEQAGLTFRILPSLAGTDFWHHTHGYTNARHATTSLVYDNTYGLNHIFNIPAEQCGV